MKFKNTLIAVTDMDKSVAFYKNVLGLRVIADFGANKTLTGGLCLQTLDTWSGFIGTSDISFGANNAELYFEENDMDSFLMKLKFYSGEICYVNEFMEHEWGQRVVRIYDPDKHIQYVHPVKEHAWGQRVVRFYDPDKHIIEVGENLKTVCLRFIASGMTPEETAKRMDVPIKFVNACIR